MQETGVIISELALVFSKLTAWLQALPVGTSPPQGITKELALKGIISEFEAFDVIPGAPGYFPIQFLMSGVIWQVAGENVLTGGGSVYAVTQNFSPVNWLNLEAPSLGNPPRGDLTLKFEPVSGIRPASIQLQIADVHVTFVSASGNALSTVLAGHTNNGARAEMAIGCLEAPTVI